MNKLNLSQNYKKDFIKKYTDLEPSKIDLSKVEIFENLYIKGKSNRIILLDSKEFIWA